MVEWIKYGWLDGWIEKNIDGWLEGRINKYGNKIDGWLDG